MLYCDRSALLKLYIEETHSDRLKSRVAEADAVAVCRIAWAEAQAALARRAREEPEDRPIIEAAKAALTSDWPHYLVLEVSQSWNAPETTPTPSLCAVTTACSWPQPSTPDG